VVPGERSPASSSAPASRAPSLPSASAAPHPNPSGTVDLNAKYRALLPSAPVSYSVKREIPVLDQLFAHVKDEYDQKLAPPPSVLARAFGIVRISRTLRRPASVTYIVERKTFLGIPYCVGWRVTAHPFPPVEKRPVPGPPPDLKPETDYVTIAPCSASSYTKVEPGTGAASPAAAATTAP